MNCFVGYKAVVFPLRTIQKLIGGKLVFAFLHKFISPKPTNNINQTVILLKTTPISLIRQ